MLGVVAALMYSSTVKLVQKHSVRNQSAAVQASAAKEAKLADGTVVSLCEVVKVNAYTVSKCPATASWFPVNRVINTDILNCKSTFDPSSAWIPCLHEGERTRNRSRDGCNLISQVFLVPDDNLRPANSFLVMQ